MKLDSYLSLSRHGVYYFRWPLARSLDRPARSTLRLSLGTRCPRRAGDLARYLACCGNELRKHRALSKLRQDEMRAMVRDYFQSLLEGHIDKVNAQGLTENQITAMRNSVWILDDAVSDVDTEHVGGMISPAHFRQTSGITDPQWLANEAFLMRELWKGRRDSLKTVLTHVEQQEHYDFQRREPVSEIAEVPQAIPIKSLQEAIDDYLDEQRHTDAWRDKTTDKIAATLDHLIEIFGKDKQISALTIQDAQEAKKILLKMPVRRKVMPQTRNLTIREAASMEGLERINPKTLNWYIQTFAASFSWSIDSVGLCCTNRLLTVLPLSLGRLIPRPL